MMFRKADKSARMSLPKAKAVHGVEIKKVPIGRYIAAIKDMEELPALIVQECFPGKSLEGILASLREVDQAEVIALVSRLLVVAPAHAVRAICGIIGADEQDVLERLTPKELADVVREFWVLNDMSDFFADVWGLLKRALPTLTTGSSDGSPSEQASG